MITHLEPDILECEDKWALESITTNKASGGDGNRDQIANIHWIIEKAREFQKNIFCFIDYTKAFDHVDHNKW